MGYGSTAVTVSLELYTETCCNCGTVFGIERDLQKRLRDHPGTSFYCPQGHQQHYTGESAEARLRRENEQLKVEIENERRRREIQRQTHATEIRGERIKRGKVEAKLKRTETRIHAGVCPHCNRTFKQLAAHVRTKHPEHDPAQARHASERLPS